MALSRPHSRPLIQARVPKRLLLVGVAAAVGLGGTYVAVVGESWIALERSVFGSGGPAGGGQDGPGGGAARGGQG